MRIRFSLALWLATCLTCPVSVYAQEAASGSPSSTASGNVEPTTAAITGQDSRHASPSRRSARKTRKTTQVSPASVEKNAPVTITQGGLPAGWQSDRIGIQTDESPADGTKNSTVLKKDTPAVGQSHKGASQTVPTGAGIQVPPSKPANKIFLPLGDDVGVAAFWSGDNFIIVADRATEMDTSALMGTGAFSQATVQTMGNTTLIVFHIDHYVPLSMSKQTGGWILAIRAEGDPAPSAGLEPQFKDGGVLYPLSRPGRVLEIADPASGARLLVVPSPVEQPGPVLGRHKLGYEIWPSVQGLVFAIESDQIEVRKGDGGAFVDVVGVDAIPVASAANSAVADDRVDWSWLGLRPLAPAMLREDYRRRWTQAALLPPEQRGPARLAAARAAFAMGDPREANAILGTAVEDSPELAIQPNVMFLQATSQLLAGNTDAASALDNPIMGADSVFWRGLYLARSGGDSAKAAAFMAQVFTNLKNYPEPLRRQLLPEVTTFIARYGSAEDRDILQPLPAEKRYDLARAFLALRQGEPEKALQQFSHLASDRDPVVASTAAVEMLRQKLALGKIRPAEAATGYERQLLLARLAGSEKEVRSTYIDALMQAGEWPKALMAADEQIARFPEERLALVPQVEKILVHLATDGVPSNGGQPANLVDSVAMIQSHIDQIPDGPDKGRVLAGLGGRLQALGLPAKAATAFERALPLAPDDASRAAWGAELAQADIAAQRLGQARRALEATKDPGADVSLASRRRVIEASLLANEGNRDQALHMLEQDEGNESLDLRGTILEEQRKWPEAVLVVGRLATKLLPETGTLSVPQQELSIRLATDAARANDWGTLDRLREWVGGRQMTPERQHIFSLLVTSPEAELRKHVADQ